MGSADRLRVRRRPLQWGLTSCALCISATLLWKVSFPGSDTGLPFSSTDSGRLQTLGPQHRLRYSLQLEPEPDPVRGRCAPVPGGQGALVGAWGWAGGGRPASPRLTPPPLAADGVGHGTRQSRHLGYGKARGCGHRGHGWPRVPEGPFPCAATGASG